MGGKRKREQMVIERTTSVSSSEYVKEFENGWVEEEEWESKRTHDGGTASRRQICN